MIEQEALKKKLDDDANRYLFVKGYIREAWNLAKAQRENQDQQYKKNKTFRNFSKDTQELIALLSNKLLLTDDFNEDDSTPFEEHWIQKDIKEFLKKNREIEKILKDKILLDALEKNKKKSVKLMARFSHPLTMAAELCHAASYKYPVPPANLILESIYGILMYAGNLIRKRAMKRDPDLKSFSPVERYSTQASSFGSLVVLGLIISAAASGPASVIIAAFLTAVGSLSVSIANLMRLGGSIVSLIKEIREHKEPKETYKWRILHRIMACAKYATSSTFYLCVSILAVTAVVAIFANPVGLAVLAGSMFTIALIAIGVSVGTLILSKIAENRINKITKEHLGNKSEESLHVSHSLNSKKKKGIGKRVLNLNHDQEERAEYLDKERGLEPGFELMRKTSSNKRKISVSSEPMTLQKYKQLSLISLKQLEAKKKHDPIYQNVKFGIEKQKSQQESEAFVIHVPKENPTSTKLEDKIERHWNMRKEVEITLNPSPDDKSLLILFDTNRGFSPLEMEHCGDPITVLKVFEAAKLMGVEVILDPRDRALIIDNKDLKLKKYFAAIENLSPEEFQAYLKNSTGSKRYKKLGEVPAQFPEKSSLNRKRNQSSTETK